MATNNLNHWIGTGNLTRDPELRALPTGKQVCELRLANNGMGRGSRDAVGYISVLVYDTPGENCAKYLSQGRRVAVDGRLEWHEWKDNDGKARHDYEIVANRVEFMPAGRPAADDDEPTGVGVAADDDIPF